MRRLAYILALVLFVNVAHMYSQKGLLKVTLNGHYLQYEDGTPFFWLGDTGWELFHRLTLEEIERYLDNRQAKGFNVIQAVILAELDGLRVPNRYGEVPLLNMNPDTPNEKYFHLVDTVIEMADRRNMVMALLPAWGDKVTLNYGGQGPVVFTPQSAYRYGLFLGKRYKDKDNIVWIMGGDRPPKHDCNDWTPVYGAMAKGIDDGSGKHFLKSFHPGGSIWESSPLLHNEDWMDFNMIQSGHAQSDQPVWQNILKDWELKPAKPTIDSEPCYEDHPINPWPAWEPSKGYFRDYEVRKQLYRSVFSGGFGVTYGHHSIWQFYNPGAEKVNYPDRYWYEALDRPAAYQAGYLRQLIESRPSVNRIPDENIVEEGQGEGAGYIAAFKDEKGRFLMVYLPIGKTITVNTSSILSERVRCRWFNPQNAETKNIGRLKNKKSMQFTPPLTGIGHDWVLVIDNE